jgi:hypothetical protein
MTWATEHFTHEWAERKGEGVYCVTCLSDEPPVLVLLQGTLDLEEEGTA